MLFIYLLTSKMYHSFHLWAWSYPWQLLLPLGWSSGKRVHFMGSKDKEEDKGKRGQRKDRLWDSGECERWHLGVRSSSGMWLRSEVKWGPGRKDPRIQLQMSHVPVSGSVMSHCDFHDWIFDTDAGISNLEFQVRGHVWVHSFSAGKLTISRCPPKCHDVQGV